MSDYAKVNAQSAVYRIAETSGDKTHLVPAPERTDGARRDRGWFNTADLIPIGDDQ